VKFLYLTAHKIAKDVTRFFLWQLFYLTLVTLRAELCLVSGRSTA
jgi:hypothetical protein